MWCAMPAPASKSRSRPAAGDATITGNVIPGSKRGAIVGMEWDKAVTGDLAKEGAARYPQLTIANNQTG